MKHTEGKFLNKLDVIDWEKAHYLSSHGYPHRVINELKYFLEDQLNDFYGKYFTLANVEKDSKRMICHDHTEDLAQKLGIKLKEIES